MRAFLLVRLAPMELFVLGTENVVFFLKSLVLGHERTVFFLKSLVLGLEIIVLFCQTLICLLQRSYLSSSGFQFFFQTIFCRRFGFWLCIPRNTLSGLFLYCIGTCRFFLRCLCAYYGYQRFLLLRRLFCRFVRLYDRPFSPSKISTRITTTAIAAAIRPYRLSGSVIGGFVGCGRFSSPSFFFTSFFPSAACG